MSGSPDAVRVLLIGSGVTSGWGVQTHGLALVGWLQQRLKRPVDVEQVSMIGGTLSHATRLIGDRAREEWDAIVVAFGLSDAMRLTPTREWAQALDRLLAKLDADMPQGLLVPVVLVGVAPTESMGLMTPIASIFRRQPERLNLLTRQAVERNRRTVFAPLPPMADSATHPQGSSEAYRVWAGAIADALIPRIESAAVRVSDPDVTAQPLSGLTAAILDEANADVRTRLQDIAQRLRTSSDADLVLINLQNSERLWSVATSGSAHIRSVPTASTFCRVTLSDGYLHLPNSTRDSRFADLAPGVSPNTAYAGVALRDPDGVAIGTVCLFNGAASGDIDREALRQVGMKIEEQFALVRLANDANPVLLRHANAKDRSPADRALSTPQSQPGPGRAANATNAELNERPLPGLINRRLRLSIEGRKLTQIAANRPSPTERDLRIQGPDPIRVLLIGGEYAVGLGTTKREEALDGALARLLHVRTGRGVIVENRSKQGVPLEQLAGSLGPAGAHTFDLVVWAPTFIEAARLFLRSRWITGISMLLRRIETTSDAAVILIGFPNLLGAQPLAVIGRARASQISRLLTRIAAHFSQVLVVEPPGIPLHHVDTVDGSQTYQQVAITLLPAAMRLLDKPRSQSTSQDPQHRELVNA